MKVYYCDECAKKIKITSKAPRVCYSNGALLCSKRCVNNYYDINFIPRCDLPDIVGEGFDDEDLPKQKCVICKAVFKGHGDDANPIADGKCCEDCCFHIVMPARAKE